MEPILKGNLFILVALILPVYTVSASSIQAEEDKTMIIASSAEMVASLDELDEIRGMGGVDVTTLNTMNVKATLTGNTATNNVTGTNVIDTSAFTGANGMFSVIQNTGNNVVIQDSTIVNVTIMN